MKVEFENLKLNSSGPADLENSPTAYMKQIKQIIDIDGRIEAINGTYYLCYAQMMSPSE